MPVPKRKRSKARRDKRFANKGMQEASTTTCKTCNEPLMTHVVCKACGHYKGVKILTTKAERTLQRTQKKEVITKNKAAKKAEGSSEASE